MAIVEGKLQLRNASAAVLELQYDAANLMSFQVASGGAVTVTGTWADLGTVTTVDVNGGTADGVVIGASASAAATVTTATVGTIIQGTTGNGYLDLRGDSGASNKVRIDDAGSLIVDSAGPHAFGVGVASNAVQFFLGGSFTSGGQASSAAALRVATDLTGAAGDIGYQAIQAFQGVSITTAGASETISKVGLVYFDEPDITVGAGDTITDAFTVYIENAPTEGTNNYALFVDAGLSRFDGDGSHVFELPADATDPTGGGGAAVGRIPIDIGGVTRYLAYY